MPKLITVFEDRYSLEPISNEHRMELSSLESIWGRQNISFSVDNRVLLRKYVGFIATPSLQLQILPKLYEDAASAEDFEEEKRSSVRMLFRLLASSGFLSVKDIPEPQLIAAMNGDLLEIFIHIFNKRFLELFQKQIHRQYEDFEGNLAFIRGRILFQRQLLRNGGFKHKHYVSYQEFTEDNLLNQIIKATMISLRTLTKNEENKTSLSHALFLLEDICPIRLTESMFQRVRFNRLNEDYRPVFELAKMFYLNRQPGVHAGDERTFTFLIPLNQLFEFSLYQWLDKGLSSDDWVVRYQTPQRYLDAEKEVFLLRPDITIACSRAGSDTPIEMIVDAKYKNPISEENTRLSESDVYQMLAYAVRYQCNRLFLVYPVFRANKYFQNPLATYLIHNGNQEIRISALHIDIASEDLDQIHQEFIKLICHFFES